MPCSRLHRLVLASTCSLLLLLLAAPAALAHGLSNTASAACAKITSFTPSSGTPGTSVTISGCGFTGATSVTFHGVSASFTVTSDTQITTTVPGGASSGKLTVTTPTKIIKSAGTFTILRVPAAITLSPTAGPPTSPVTVSGVNFGNQEAVDVYFDTTDQALAATTVQGAFSISIQVPTSAVPGTHWVTAIGRHSGLSAQTSFLARTDWAQFHDDLRRTGVNPYENVLSPTNVARLDIGWKAAPRSGINSSPAVTNGVVYVGSDDGHLYAFNAQTGTQLWTAATGGVIRSSPAVANGVVYVGSFDGHLYAFNAQTGVQLWAAATGDIIFSSPAVANGVVYVGSNDGSLYAYMLPAGSQLQAPPRPSLRSLHPDLRLHVGS